MDHVVLQGTHVPNIEGPRPLMEAELSADAASGLGLQLHTQRATPKNRQASVKQRGATICVPAILSFSNLADLHRSVGEGIV